MLFLAGLGNPGPRYAKTRHNVGFLFLDELLSRATNSKLMKKKRYHAYRVDHCGSVLLLKPLLFMNLSGIAVKEALKDLSFSDQDRLVVVYDDVWIPLGRIRIRNGGSDGGHKGIRSIIRELGRSNFTRMRIGIGPAAPERELTDFVLEDFSRQEQNTIDEVIKIAADAAIELCSSDLNKVMSRYNSMEVNSEDE